MAVANERPALPDSGRPSFLALAAGFALLAGALLIWAGPSPSALRLSMLRRVVTSEALAIDTMLRSYAALGRLIATQATQLGRPERMATALAQLVRDDLNICNVILVAPTGGVLLEARPAAGAAAASDVALVDRLVPAPGDDPRTPEFLVRSSEAGPPPRLIGVDTGVYGVDPRRALRVIILMQARNLPGAPTANRHSLLIGNDGAVIAGPRGDAPGVEAPEDAAGRDAIARISYRWRTVHASPGQRGALELAMADGLHRLLFEQLAGWPAAVLVDVGLAVPPLLQWNEATALALILAAIAAAALGIRRGGPMTARLAATAGRPPIEPGLAIALAHDFNNVLTVLSADAEMMAALQPEDATLRQLGRSMQEATQTGAALVGQVLAVAGRLDLSPCLVNLGAKLARRHSELTACLRNGQRLLGNYAGPAVFARVDPQALHTALSGLLQDVARWAPANAEIHLDVQNIPCLAVVIEIGGLAQGADLRQGLRFAAAAGFARQSGGGLALAAGPGGRTRFVLTLPEATGPVPQAVAPKLPVRFAAPPVSRPAPRQILVVDDNVPVRQSIARRLRLEGYAVAEAATVADAEALVGGGVDLMVTDIVLGGATDGWSLAVRARALDSTLPLVFMSGFMSARQPDLLAGDERASFVRKPVDANELNTVIAGLLALRNPLAAGAPSLSA